MFTYQRCPYNPELWDSPENQNILAFDTQLELTRSYFFGWIKYSPGWLTSHKEMSCGERAPFSSDPIGIQRLKKKNKANCDEVEQYKP